jgi:hypothetical protein
MVICTARAGTFLHSVQIGVVAHPDTCPLGNWGFFPGVKGRGREAQSTSCAEVKNAWSSTSTPPHVFMTPCLIRHRDYFTFCFLSSVFGVTEGKFFFGFPKFSESLK